MIPAIDVDDVVHSFGRHRALDHFSLEAAPGVVGLLGPNGAGKTTLLRGLATVLPFDTGEVRLLGRDLRRTDERTEVRRRLGYLPQDVGFHRSFTCFEAIDYIAVLKEHTRTAARHDEVRRVLDLVGLSEHAGKKIRTLSGGMRRRLGLAQALLGTPELLVLDEPTVGLDPEQRINFRDIISDAGAGRTVVLSTHQTEDVAAICSQIVVVDQGRPLFQGSPQELAGVAAGRIWVSDEKEPGALASWRVGSGRHHLIGDPPAGAELVDPSIEDGYLLLLNGTPAELRA